MASTLNVDTIQGSATATSVDLSGVTNLQMPTGATLQTVSVATDHQQSFNTTAYTTFANFSPSITPKFSNSKVLLNICLHFGENQDAFPAFKVYRTVGGVSTQVAQGANLQQRASFAYVGTENSSRDTYRITLVTWTFLDSPATTSAITYRVDASPMRTTARTMYFNRHEQMSDANRASTISTFTLQEIAG